ncbi:MAG: ferritin-like domain-containing protein [Alphaproteobacteria bacterium]|nr:ferritin-like domain-containing protein [Alphaproteobacteria bacterium]
MTGHWTLADIAWDRFDPGKVSLDLLSIVKAAAMVESNGRDYARYLRGVFPDDRAFQAAADNWADEEVQHGEALGRWAMLADPNFSYAESLQVFRAGYRVPTGVDGSVRGSRTGELIARCMVEVGTSSYYTALAEASEEPVLSEICRRIAADELRHYRLFYKNMKRYLDVEQLGLPRRIAVAVSRIAETEDDELAYAYHAANMADRPYDRRASYRAYSRRAFPLYRPRHLDRAIGMIFKAVGLKPQGMLHRAMTRLAAFLVGNQIRRLARAAA